MNPIVRLLFDWRGTDLVVECRRCGTNLSLGSRTCSECGSSSIATYEIS